MQKVISRIESKDFSTRSNAITDAALILEMHAWKLGYEQRVFRYSTFLADDLVKVTLTEQDQKEIVIFLKNLVVKKDELSNSLIWAIGKASPTVSLVFLLEIIEQQCLTFNDEELYQLMTALGNLLFFDPSDSLSEESLQLVSQFKVVQFLEKVTSASLVDNPFSDRLKETAQGLLDAVNNSSQS